LGAVRAAQELPAVVAAHHPVAAVHLIGDGVSWTNMVSLLLRCCSASVSHAFAMASKARLFSTLVNV
jgi:hypothetical protein